MRRPTEEKAFKNLEKYYIYDTVNNKYISKSFVPTGYLKDIYSEINSLYQDGIDESNIIRVVSEKYSIKPLTVIIINNIIPSE